MEEGEDERREAAIASILSLRPNFNPNTKLKQAQLAKFQELHRRRLQLKAKPKTKKASKGMVDGSGKSRGKVLIAEECTDEGASKVVEEFSVSISTGSNTRDDSLQQNNIPKEMASKKRQKLHWGLDTKERWERKSNM